MNVFLAGASLIASLANADADSPRWRMIPGIPLHTISRLNLIGDFLHIQGNVLKIGEDGWFGPFPEQSCRFSGRYGLCVTYPSADMPEEVLNWGAVDLEHDRKRRFVHGGSNAYQNAIASLNNGPDSIWGQRTRNGLAWSAMTEKGVALTVVEDDVFKLMAFVTKDSTAPDGSMEKVWQFTGYSSCSDCRRPNKIMPGPTSIQEVGSVGSVFWLRDRQGGRGKFWTSQDSGRTWQIAPEDIINGGQRLSDPTRPLVETCNTALDSWRLCTSRDGGSTWESTHPVPSGFGEFRYVGDRILGYEILSGGLKIISSDDHGATWNPLRSEVRAPLSHMEDYAITPQGGLVILNQGMLQYIKDPLAPWVSLDTRPFRNAPWKIRTTPDAVYIAQPGAGTGYNGLTLFRYRDSTWNAIREDIRDFEVASGKIFTLSAKTHFREKQPNSIDATGHQSYEVILERQAPTGEWDTIMSHTYPEQDCNAGYKGMGISCPSPRAELSSDGRNDLLIIRLPDSLHNGDSSYLRSRDFGSTWTAEGAAFGIAPRIDTNTVRLDESYNIYLLQRSIDTRIASRSTHPRIAIHHRTLHLDLSSPERVRISAFTPDGRATAIASTGELSPGPHAFPLTGGKGLLVVKIQIGQELRVVPVLLP